LLLTIFFCCAFSPAVFAEGLAQTDQIILTWTADPATSQTITWLMSSNSLAHVQYLKAEDFNGNFDSARQIEAAGVVFDSTNYRYTATVSGLTPDTKYVYRVGNEGAWSEPLSFTTAADTEKFSFLYMGDVQSGYSEWGDTLKSVYQAYPEIKFGLLGGDLTNNGSDENEWGQFLDAASSVFSQIPVMPTMGNHDGAMYLKFFALPDNGPEGLKQQFYSFDYGNAHFVILDTSMNTDKMVKRWLQEDLQNTTKKWKFAVFHIPAYPAFTDYKGIDKSIRENWVPILEQNRVAMVFVGHQHLYMRTHPIYQGEVQNDSYGIVYVMGNAGSKTYGGSEDFPYIASKEPGSNYQVININDDFLTLTAKKATGELIESYTLTVPESSKINPPTLIADTTDNTVGNSIELTFEDNENWRDAITEVMVNDIVLKNDKYSVEAGNLIIDASVFTEAGIYTIVVKAAGYIDAVVKQQINKESVQPEIEKPQYNVIPKEDPVYTIGVTVDGIKTLTVNPNQTGFKYFSVSIEPVKAHEGTETVVFTQLRNGIQLQLNAAVADFDTLQAAQTGFNVKVGDVIKAYIVDDLNNAEDFNPTVLQ